MMSTILTFYSSAMDTIFSEKFWLPENASWSDLANPRRGVFYPSFSDLWMLPIYTAFLFVLRYFLEVLLYRPIGRRLFGLKNPAPIHLRPHPKLERAYREMKRPDSKLVKRLASETLMSERQIERWLRLRRNQDKSSRLTKFTESGWRFTFYFVALIYGVWTLIDKPWLTDQRQCWIGHPLQHIDADVYWYYMLELSFYMSAAISIFVEVKRKDFWQMFIHHIATILLISFSWVTNFVRIGTLVFLVHDVADPWMEIAKMMKYARKEYIGIATFSVFVTLWIGTRIFVYPIWLLYTVIFDTVDILGTFGSLRLFEGLLLLLQVLHVVWTFLILKIPYRILREGVIQDSRSDSEMESLSGDDSTWIEDSMNNNNNYNNNNNNDINSIGHDDKSYQNGTKGGLRTKIE